MPELTLADYGLTREAIAGGEKPEFDAIPGNKVQRKKEYLDYSVTNSLVQAYNNELYDTYLENDRLVSENEDLKQQVSDLTNAEETLRTVEQTVATANQHLTQIQSERTRDLEKISLLEGQLDSHDALKQRCATLEQELLTMKDTVPELEATVNEVLENLRQNMIAHGIRVDEL